MLLNSIAIHASGIKFISTIHWVPTVSVTITQAFYHQVSVCVVAHFLFIFNPHPPLIPAAFNLIFFLLREI